ncbi:MAG: Laccase domain protein YfiH [Alphaproteobacteria bacterium MarineAlpha9_Bin4]|nr:polyphenol oxidase [Pelagibacterales bacterium]PPR27207.1 MAG: Laccase domain protein YfiH [Alphaproteobacteria bacterium MarineAlpha9_Bin4]|tara:strand:+ start:270 stop:1019 length:750 start_codon:yes stop_codon:yes gene_type:complete
MIYLKSNNLSHFQHGFFSRIGGVSKSLYSSLNCGFSSHDDRKNIIENRNRILNQFNIKIEKLIIPDQFHSNKIEVFDKNKSIYKCDGMISISSGIAIGVLTADCCPILIGHKQKKLVGVIHAGWKGVFNGIVENFLTQVNKLGFKKNDLMFALGPCIGKSSYEVTDLFKNNFLKKYNESSIFFKPNKHKNRFNFNLRGCIISILKKNDISDIWTSRADTYKHPKKYFSYRYSVHKGCKDYGRMMSLILK